MANGIPTDPSDSAPLPDDSIEGLSSEDVLASIERILDSPETEEKETLRARCGFAPDIESKVKVVSMVERVTPKRVEEERDFFANGNSYFEPASIEEGGIALGSRNAAYRDHGPKLAEIVLIIEAQNGQINGGYGLRVHEDGWVWVNPHKSLDLEHPPLNQENERAVAEMRELFGVTEPFNTTRAMERLEAFYRDEFFETIGRRDSPPIGAVAYI